MACRLAPCASALPGSPCGSAGAMPEGEATPPPPRGSLQWTAVHMKLHPMNLCQRPLAGWPLKIRPSDPLAEEVDGTHDLLQGAPVQLHGSLGVGPKGAALEPHLQELGLPLLFIQESLHARHVLEQKR